MQNKQLKVLTHETENPELAIHRLTQKESEQVESISNLRQDVVQLEVRLRQLKHFDADEIESAQELFAQIKETKAQLFRKRQDLQAAESALEQIRADLTSAEKAWNKFRINAVRADFWDLVLRQKEALQILLETQRASYGIFARAAKEELRLDDFLLFTQTSEENLLQRLDLIAKHAPLFSDLDEKQKVS